MPFLSCIIFYYILMCAVWVSVDELSDEENTPEEIKEVEINKEEKMTEEKDVEIINITDDTPTEKITPKKQFTLDSFIKRHKDNKTSESTAKKEEKIKQKQIKDESTKTAEKDAVVTIEESEVIKIKDSSEPVKIDTPPVSEKTVESTEMIASPSKSSEANEKITESEQEIEDADEKAESSNENDKEDDSDIEITDVSIIEETDTSQLDETLDTSVTPIKRNLRNNKNDIGSDKKTPAKKSSQEEREKKRLEAKEQRERQKQEKLAQKIKEKQEKEEQRQKEKLEKEEQKRKEREEKEEQKRKEREEKEEQKRKEKEEKEEQKRKEREEKDEQKRKEKEEKDLKKLEDLQREKKKKEKESAAFVSFFVARKSANPNELSKTEETISSNFMPFEIKADMRLAPVVRNSISDERKKNLVDIIENQNEEKLYLKELKNGKTVGKSAKTLLLEDNEVMIVEEIDIGECVEEQAKAEKIRAKLLKFKENRRPPYYGTWRKKSKFIRPRRPFAQDKQFFDYEVDSDDDWEEEEPGESLQGSDDEDKEKDEEDDYEVDNEFFVPHGYLSDEEIENEENIQLTPESQKQKLKLLQMEFEEEMNTKTQRIKPRLIGCIWESKLKPKVQDAINAFLEERMAIITGPIIIKKRDLLQSASKTNTGNKNSTPSRKLLPKELIPEFLNLVHGNINSKAIITAEFFKYMLINNPDVTVTKVGLTSQLNEMAKWMRCPEKGQMYNKFCWYVNEEARSQFNLNLTLPNKWNYTNNEDGVNSRKKLSL